MEEFLEVVLSMQSMPRLYNENHWIKLVVSQSPACKDVSTEAEEYSLLGAAT
jgi:hypothetical protein